MKRKFSLFLNIAMLCLSVCAIAFGVYSAQQARLNITGNLGFTAHNAFVSVTGTIKNVAQIENDNVVSKTDIQIDKIVKSADTANPVDISMPLGDMYFYSNNDNVSAEDMVFELTFTNLGKTDIMATVTKPSGLSSTVSVIDNSDNNHGLYIAFDGSNQYSKFIMHGKSITIMFALHLNVMSTLSTKVAFNLPINFEEYQMFKSADDFFWNNNSNNTRTYVNMGQVSSTDKTALRWYIFAKGNTDGSGMQAVTASVLNANKTLDAGNYWFISEYVLDYGTIFDDSSNIYGNSDIKAYLDNNDSSTTIETKFTSVHSISSNDAVYSQITGRNLTEDYTGESANKVGTFTAVENQKLWLLSVEELKYLNSGTSCDTYLKNNDFVYYPKIIAQDISSTTSDWWLRSMVKDGGGDVFTVRMDGAVGNDSFPTLDYYVRPAFQITIS